MHLSVARREKWQEGIIGEEANYALLPLFTTGDAEVHPLSFGFSIDF